MTHACSSHKLTFTVRSRILFAERGGFCNVWQSCLGIDGWEALYSTLPHPHDDDGVAWAYPGTTGESYMNTACLNAGITQPLLRLASHLTTFTIEAERILSLDATISERRARLILFFPLEGAATFSLHSQRNHLQFIYNRILFSFQDSTPFSGGSARRGATSSIGGASRAAGTEIIYGAYPQSF